MSYLFGVDGTGPEKKILKNGNHCPNCGEVMYPADLEMFHRCPFCNHLFPDNTQLEDFILIPELKRWSDGVIHMTFMP